MSICGACSRNSNDMVPWPLQEQAYMLKCNNKEGRTPTYPYSTFICDIGMKQTLKVMQNIQKSTQNENIYIYGTEKEREEYNQKCVFML